MAAGVTLTDMTTDLDMHTIVVQELRLRDGADATEAAHIVAAARAGLGTAVPLLTSIDDERDVVVVRAVHEGETPESEFAQRSPLDGLAASWQPAQRYTPRIAERSGAEPSHFRLAVTGSGINNAVDPVGPVPDGIPHEPTRTRLDLLWVGVPLDTYGGLLVLIGSDGDEVVRPEPREWPLPLSQSLGVRIYDSRR